MEKMIVFLIPVAMVCGITAKAHADLVTFNLNNVTFADGGSAVGSITVDTSADAFSNINITVSDPVQGQVAFNIQSGVGQNNQFFTSSSNLTGLSGIPVLSNNEAFYVLGEWIPGQGWCTLQFYTDGSGGIVGGGNINTKPDRKCRIL